MGTTLTEALDEVAPRLFYRDELVALMPGTSPEYLDAELATLVEGGRVLRPTADMYFYGRKTRFGTGYPSGIDVAFKIYGENSGVGWTAAATANRLHLSTQVPMVEMLAVPYLVEILLPRIVLIDRSDRPARAKAGLTFIETSVLEALGDTMWWEYETPRGLTKIAELMRGRETFNAERIRAGSVNDPAEAIELLGELLALL